MMKLIHAKEIRDRERAFVDVPLQRCGGITTITESLWMASCIQDSGGS